VAGFGEKAAVSGGFAGRSGVKDPASPDEKFPGWTIHRGALDIGMEVDPADKRVQRRWIPDGGEGRQPARPLEETGKDGAECGPDSGFLVPQVFEPRLGAGREGPEGPDP